MCRGEVTPRDYDLAVVKRLGAYIGIVQDYDGKDVSTYLIDVVGVEGPIRVMFNNPNARLVKEVIPYMNIQVDYPEEALERSQGPLALAYSGIDPETGLLCERLIATPFDFRYTFNAFLRKRSEYNAVLSLFVKKFAKLSAIRVTDSLGGIRVFPFKTEGGSDITNVIDSAERYPAISYTIKIEGELELTDEQCTDKFVGEQGKETQALQPVSFSEMFCRLALVIQKNSDGSIRIDSGGDPVYLETEIVYFNPLDTPHDGDDELAKVDVFVIAVDTMGEPIRDLSGEIIYASKETLVVRPSNVPKVAEDGTVNAETFEGTKVNSDDTQFLDENNNVIKKEFDIMLKTPNENGTWIEQTVTMGVCINLDIKEC